ncbi:hypothetical protein AMECASPLE_001620 [Ameca splendens]|uniref:Uncharacterized protein n=1 Tax=Ameca splendens TaxID=208324 RepID=A0ABV0XM66_9TELE
MQSSHWLHLSAPALERNQHHATHLWMCSYIQPSDRQTVPDFRKHFPASCLTSLALELDPVSVYGFTPQPSHWFIQPEPAWFSSLPGSIVKRTITALCVPATASDDSLEDLDQSAIRLQSVGLFHINCLDHILFWILDLIPRLRSDSWKLTVGYLCADPALLNKPFNLFT